MVEIGLSPIRMREATLDIEADSYRASVNQVIFVPELLWEWTPVWGDHEPQPLRPDPRWTVHLGFVQDLTTPNSLTSYLVEHAAQQRTVTFSVPGRVIAATVLIVPGQFGGTIGQIPVATVALPMYGQPDMAAEAAA